MSPIRIAIVGVGNCASSLLQGIQYYQDRSAENAVGLMHWKIGQYKPADIEVVAAFDIDRRKVGLDVHKAIFCEPNCTTTFCSDLPQSGVAVRMGKVLDGFSEHMKDYDQKETFELADDPQASAEEIISVLKESGTEMLLNYLPVGSEQASRFYADCALKAGTALINNIPVFIASDPEWVKKFEQKNIPLIGDDIKAQLGATITHRALTALCRKRGAEL